MAFQRLLPSSLCKVMPLPSLPLRSRRALPITAAAKTAAPSRLAERHAKKEAQRAEKERLEKAESVKSKASKGKRSETRTKADRELLRKQRQAAPTKVGHQQCWIDSTVMCRPRTVCKVIYMC